MKKMQKKMILKEESYKIIGASFEVYKTMEYGFLEAVYQECLAKEFKHQNIPYESQKTIHLDYKGEILTQKYISDFIYFDSIIVEIKAVSNLTDEHRSQILNYLNATKFKLGLLINFGHFPKIEYERFVS